MSISACYHQRKETAACIEYGAVTRDSSVSCQLSTESRHTSLAECAKGARGRKKLSAVEVRNASSACSNESSEKLHSDLCCSCWKPQSCASGFACHFEMHLFSSITTAKVADLETKGKCLSGKRKGKEKPRQPTIWLAFLLSWHCSEERVRANFLAQLFLLET